MEANDSNRDGGTYTAIRIGDIADWRLIGVISDTGIGAWLKHSDPMRAVETMFNLKWPAHSEDLLSRIENAVYDHPQVLDDFAADIAVVAPKAIWVPSDLVGDDDDEARRLYSRIYPAEPDDIMIEQVDDATCAYSLVPGLKAFLQRTFPGARIHSHLAVMMRRFRERSADMPRVYIDIRDNEVDFIAFDRRNLLMAATHPWHSLTDIQYHLFNIMSVYGLNPDEAQVSVSGPRELKTELVQELRKQVAYVMLTMLPSISSDISLPLSASLLLRK